MITFTGVTRKFGDRAVVNNLDLTIQSGEAVMLVGPSGCGKTTTLKMINRLVEPTSGLIEIDGVDTRTREVTELRRSIGYVIQQVGLFPHLSVRENVATVMRLSGWNKRRINDRVDELLELVGLPASEYANRLPSALSGGQQQRIGVARALGTDPIMLLMDEPFGAIDPVTRDRLQDELIRLQRVVRKTIVFVTHDIDEAIKLGDRIALFTPDGKLAQYATPAELLARPASPYVEEFLGAGRLVRRLGLVPLREVKLGSLEGVKPDGEVDAGATLRDALEEVLRSRTGKVMVRDGGKPVGVVDSETIRRAGQ
ncbi:MAG: ABC transporter ATP-binding protein [Candidatus Dormibacteria bacterium]